jgi:membrane-bound lytic murein transglycosylase D
MDLRAFLINQIEPYALKKELYCLFVFFVSFSYANANRQVQLQEAPHEIQFANVVFKLNDATRFLLQEEVSKLEKNENALKRDLELLTLFLPEVGKALNGAEVPSDFLYLSFYNKFQINNQESTLLEDGVYWCLNKQLALDLDMRVNNRIDERKNFFIAMDAAITCLRRNNVLYNNWGTTLYAQIASREFINGLGINKSWNGQDFVALESPAYSSLIQFLAFKMVMEKEYPNYHSSENEFIFKYSYGKGKTLELIAADLRFDVNHLRKTNLWLQKESKIEDDSPVLILVPSTRIEEVKTLAELSRYTNTSLGISGFPVLDRDFSLSQGKGGDFYKINGKKGIKADVCDSHVTLAYKSAIPLKNFLEYNDMSENEVVHIGQVYYLEEKDNKGPLEFHTATENESLWDISMLYGVKLADLLKFNRLEEILKLQKGRIVYMQNKRPKNFEAEHIELVERTIPELELKNDPILKTSTSFEWPNTDAELEVKEVAEKQLIVAEISEKPAARKEVEVRAVTKESYSSNLKNQVLGLSKIEEEKEESLPEYVTHIVKKGETLYRISVNYRVTVNQLYKLNSLRTDIIEIGDKIKVKPF